MSTLISFHIAILLLLVPGIISFSPRVITRIGFATPEQCVSMPTTGARIANASCMNMSSRSGAGDNVEDLLEKASRLRREAEELKDLVPVRRDGGGQENVMPKKVVYTSLGDSTWEVSYRFASDAVKRDDDDNNDEEMKTLVFYSGKVSIQLTNDGFTNILESESTSKSTLTFQKFWGWDEETSNEDELQYILFSADVDLPSSDPNYDEKKKQNNSIRFYFQCEVIRDSRIGEITMRDGTVTLKKDIKPPGGFWGVFNGGGILAQFRYCGECLMKPC